MNEIVSFAVEKINKLKEDDRFIYLDMYIALIGLNSNKSFISKEVYEDAKPTIEYIPICAMLNSKKSDFLEHEKKLKCIGTVLSLRDNNYRYETIDDNEYAVVNGIIFKEYCPEEALILLVDELKKTSLELEVLKKTKKDGLFYFEKIRYQSCVILGDKYTEGMEGCHLEIASDYKQTYSQDVEKIKYVFSSNQLVNDEIDINKSTESEDDEMVFNKVEFAQQYGMSANQIKDMMNESCVNIKYTAGDYEYTKYWVSDYCGKYAYAYDYELSKYVAIPYMLEEGKANMDFASAKPVRSVQTWVVEGEDDYPEVDLVEEVLVKILEKLNAEKTEMFTKMNTENEELLVKMSQRDESLLTMGQELDTLKEQYVAKETEIEAFKSTNETLISENENLKNEVTKFANEKKEVEAETVLSKYAKKINEDERKELFAKLDKSKPIADFEKEVKAFVCDKYEAELKGKKEIGTYSKMNVNSTPEDKSNDTHWTSYYKDYKETI